MNGTGKQHPHTHTTPLKHPFNLGVATTTRTQERANRRGGSLSTNSESNGRFHSNWLNMMYPRLKLARNLLAEDGVIFISIDDYEAAHLVQIGNEIFGSDNALTSDCSGPFVWPKSGATAGHAVRNHEYIYAWARNKKKLPFFKLSSYGDDSQIQDRALKKSQSQTRPQPSHLKKVCVSKGKMGSSQGSSARVKLWKSTVR
ncbi:DNA methyltransferase [Corynebacterium belfantii]|uniref:DNA methyltransferase n=1 Tax=Corynebacterium belfantii TaxID=2014537 RepID=UPI0035E44897